MNAGLRPGVRDHEPLRGHLARVRRFTVLAAAIRDAVLLAGAAVAASVSWWHGEPVSLRAVMCAGWGLGALTCTAAAASAWYSRRAATRGRS